jgi:hypothetical protein
MLKDLLSAVKSVYVPISAFQAPIHFNSPMWMSFDYMLCVCIPFMQSDRNPAMIVVKNMYLYDCIWITNHYFNLVHFSVLTGLLLTKVVSISMSGEINVLSVLKDADSGLEISPNGIKTHLFFDVNHTA